MNQNAQWSEDAVPPRIVQAYLRDTTTGECAIVEHMETTGVYHLGYMWIDGNYGCDCNRRIFMDEVLGKEIKDLDEYPCNIGENEVVLEKFIDTATGIDLLSQWAWRNT